jgi:hypothetical protein
MYLKLALKKYVTQINRQKSKKKPQIGAFSIVIRVYKTTKAFK